jgi:hypothetical protein
MRARTIPSLTLRAGVTAALLSLATVSSVGAQNCLGLPSFAAAPLRVDGGFRSGDDVATFSGGLSVGAASGPFGSLAYDRTNFDDQGTNVDLSANGFTLTGGYELDLASPAGTASGGRRFSLCPVVGFSWAKMDFDEIGDEIDITMRKLSLGVSVGTPVASSPTLSVVPFGTLQFVNATGSVDAFGTDDSESEQGGQIDLGIGLVLNRLFTIRPVVSIPIGFEGVDTSFGVTVHFNFGRTR